MSQEGAVPCTILPGLSVAFQKWTNAIYSKIRDHKKSGQTGCLAYSRDGQVIVRPSLIQSFCFPLLCHHWAGVCLFLSPLDRCVPLPAPTGQVCASSCHHWTGVHPFLSPLGRCVLLSGVCCQLNTCLKMESPVLTF